MINRIAAFLNSAAGIFNLISAGAVFAIMIIIVGDVTLRFFGIPVAGAFDLVGLLGAVAISFALAYTSIERGHIAVEFLFLKLPERGRYVMTAVNESVAAVFFGIVSWRTAVYALELRSGGEVSLTVQLPVYPFVMGISISAALLAAVLLFNFIKTVRWLIRR